MFEVEINIQGAGLAGLSSAIFLSNVGINVSVAEKYDHIGIAHNENTQAMRNYGQGEDLLIEFKNMGLKLKNLKPIYRINKYAPSLRKSIIYSKDKPLFYVFKRGPREDSIDHQLYDQAVSNGTNFNFSYSFKNSEIDVVARGPTYNTGFGYGKVFQDVDIDAGLIHFLLDNKYAPDGYLYALPFGKHELTIAITSFRKNVFELKNLFDKFMVENKVFSELVEGGGIKHDFSGTGFYSLPKTAVIGRKYYVGGAAGFVEASRGFGDYYAVKSGFHVSRAINEKLDYDKLWRDDFGKELFEGFSKRMFLRGLDNSGYEKLIPKKEKIEISEYAKLSKRILKLFLELYAVKKLNNWRQEYPLIP